MKRPRLRTCCRKFETCPPPLRTKKQSRIVSLSLRPGLFRILRTPQTYNLILVFGTAANQNYYGLGAVTFAQLSATQHMGTSNYFSTVDATSVGIGEYVGVKPCAGDQPEVESKDAQMSSRKMSVPSFPTGRLGFSTQAQHPATHFEGTPQHNNRRRTRNVPRKDAQ